MSSALIVDHDPSALKLLSASLSDAAWTTVCATCGRDALREVSQAPFSVIVAEVRLPDLNGFDLISSVRNQQPQIGAVFVTEHPNMHDALRAGRIGALGYLTKPCVPSELQNACASATRRPARDPDILADDEFHGIIGTSANMREVFRQLAIVAPLPSLVLIRGETGTGKELVARAIHSRSKRSGPFVAANVASFPSTLIEDALFGHERGAFTGADVSREGLFEQARGGTVFLDEIGELEPALQVKLLRVIDTHQLLRLGGVIDRRFDARIVAATNVDLEAAQAQGRFRPDLFYRLRQTEIHLPPLRDRGDDVLRLIDYYLIKITRELGGQALTVSPGAIDCLRAYHWPGNVRELESSLRRAAILASAPTIEREHLPLEVKLSSVQAASVSGRRPQGVSLSDAIAAAAAALERQWIEEAIRESAGNIGIAAKQLGVDPKTLYEKRRRYGLLSRC